MSAAQAEEALISAVEHGALVEAAATAASEVAAAHAHVLMAERDQLGAVLFIIKNCRDTNCCVETDSMGYLL